jgi:hypothetical protein
VLTISKLEAAERQLMVAVELYFQNGDEVATHTLSSAAHSVVRGISKVRGRGTSKEAVEELLTAEGQKAFHDAWVRAENFFKHANKDPDGVLDFDPKETEIILFDAVSYFMVLTGRQPDSFKVFKFWFLFQEPLLVLPRPEAQAILNKYRAFVLGMGRPEFYEMMITKLQEE